jgi:hypothetical protein
VLSFLNEILYLLLPFVNQWIAFFCFTAREMFRKLTAFGIRHSQVRGFSATPTARAISPFALYLKKVRTHPATKAALDALPVRQQGAQVAKWYRSLNEIALYTLKAEAKKHKSFVRTTRTKNRKQQKPSKFNHFVAAFLKASKNLPPKIRFTTAIRAGAAWVKKGRRGDPKAAGKAAGLKAAPKFFS